MSDISSSPRAGAVEQQFSQILQQAGRLTGMEMTDMSHIASSSRAVAQEQLTNQMIQLLQHVTGVTGGASHGPHLPPRRRVETPDIASSSRAGAQEQRNSQMLQLLQHATGMMGGASHGPHIPPGRRVETPEITSSSRSVAGAGHQQIDQRLLKAAMSGDSAQLIAMTSDDPHIIFGRTPQGNNCLHIASIYGRQQFCKDVLEKQESLLLDVNSEGETPLLIAITLGHISLAYYLLEWFRLPQGVLVGNRDGRYSPEILAQDKDEWNTALHHAIRNGHGFLAIDLITAEPELSKCNNKFRESPMFIAVMRDLENVVEKLLEIRGSSHSGSDGHNALHAAVRTGNIEILKRIMRARPELAIEADNDANTPTRLAVIHNKVDILRVLLGYDRSLGYEVSNKGFTLLTTAATRGHVAVARALLAYCPDALCRHVHPQGLTCLHAAIINGHMKFVEFILTTPRLRKVVNMRDGQGKTALHYAIEKCNPRMVSALLALRDIDTTLPDKSGTSAASVLLRNKDQTLDWKEMHVLLSKADPKDDDISFSDIRKEAEPETIESKKEMNSRTQKYTSNTSLVAILLATITFTAAFTLPGGYSSDPGSAGLPVMSKEVAFQAFLVADTLAMCSAFVVAVICLMGRWEDEKFTTYYIFVTKQLTWFAYMATLAAFASGLYTVLPSHLRWLSIGICSLVGFLPIMTLVVNKWPILKRNFRLGRAWPVLIFCNKRHQPFNSSFHDNSDLPEGYGDERV